MKPFNRTLYRVALQIEQGLQSEAEAPPPPSEALQFAWRQLSRTLHRAAWARRQGWRGVNLSLPRDLRYWANELTGAVGRVVSHFETRPQSLPNLTRAIYEDLLALEEEFEEVEVDLQEKVLSVTTGPIQLEGIELGRFQVRLKWRKFQESRAYDVLALEANPAATSSSTTHPHVQSDVLCEGEGRTAIRSALEQGRVLDFFLLVQQVLQTYNSGSAYIHLSDWSGVECSDCGTTASEEDSSSCGLCDSSLCSDCSRSCGSCHRCLCNSCSSLCEGCDTDFCSACLTDCTACGERYCSECLTSGQCRSCRENQENEDEEENTAPESEAPAESLATDITVQPQCLGEAGVSA
jgi:hypothetical protein